MRSKARETILQYLYASAKNGKNEGLLISLSKENKLTDEDMKFAQKLLDLVFSNKEELISLISDYLENFSWKRVFFMDKLILIMGFAEMKYMDTPKKVVLDETANLSSKYSGDNSPDFVNGVLGRYYKDVQNGNNN